MSAMPIVFLFISIAVFLNTVSVSSDDRLGERECSTNAQCPSDSCCVKEMGNGAQTPICKPYRQKDEYCWNGLITMISGIYYWNGTSLTFEDVYGIECPCADGLSCKMKTQNEKHTCQP